MLGGLISVRMDTWCYGQPHLGSFPFPGPLGLPAGEQVGDVPAAGLAQAMRHQGRCRRVHVQRQVHNCLPSREEISHPRMNTFMHSRVCVCTPCVHTHARACTHKYTHIHTDIHIYIHYHIHTHTCTQTCTHTPYGEPRSLPEASHITRLQAVCQDTARTSLHQ
jgi:hypothetical protein